ncbi:hypothetical protein SAMN05216228_105321 [Rhizobium tibeticum]|uniref:Uncharacterized protein n=1 Tax=Rhizobium tibeticum TaxID=501024 RepID=A0ABY1AX00_9HYPH|nr:hypothetical protein SAMN05216228_105321 [Rhizobium tibeticum]
MISVCRCRRRKASYEITVGDGGDAGGTLAERKPRAGWGTSPAQQGQLSNNLPYSLWRHPPEKPPILPAGLGRRKQTSSDLSTPETDPRPHRARAAGRCPVGSGGNATTVRQHALQGTKRIERELTEKQVSFMQDACPRDWMNLPVPNGRIFIGLDGGYNPGPQRSKEELRTDRSVLSMATIASHSGVLWNPRQSTQFPLVRLKRPLAPPPAFLLLLW